MSTCISCIQSCLFSNLFSQLFVVFPSKKEKKHTDVCFSANMQGVTETSFVLH